MKRGYVYVMTNGPSGTLYVGVTANLSARIWQHRNGEGSDLCKRYGLDRLVHVEEFASIGEAIVREKVLKAWQRSWKLNLMGRNNPDWVDLFDPINGRHESPTAMDPSLRWGDRG